MQLLHKLSGIWEELYPGIDTDILKNFISEIESTKQLIQFPDHEDGWFKDAIIYSLYVDLFNVDFYGLREKLDYLQELGVNCLWLLPILDSPMKDAGFDIRNYDRIRVDLLGLDESSTLEARQKLFREFLQEAHKRGLKVIFDIAINHTSEEHPWFVESRKSVDVRFVVYIWSKDTNLYKEARIISEGLCESNWEKDGEWYYFPPVF
ncbi:MAG: alpha-amylase family glycosyl hydrolase [Bacteroidales bacterium]